jgi:hypothetical protein
MAHSLHCRIPGASSDPSPCLRHPALRLPFCPKSSLAAADAVLHPHMCTLLQARVGDNVRPPIFSCHNAREEHFQK